MRDLAEFMQYALGDEQHDNELDRIILYIDDLDRCDPQRVADVLEAVHLLLTFPLFAVVVGVSPGWLERSLANRHPVLLQGNEASDAGTTSPADYLEKIFQLSYSLRPLEADKAGGLLAGMAALSMSATVDRGVQTSTADDVASSLIGAAEQVVKTDTELERGLTEGRSAETLARSLALHPGELVQLDRVASLVSTSPRRAQRFLNLYLVIRARFADTGVDSEAALLTLALAVGAPRSVAAMLHECANDRVAESGQAIQSIGEFVVPTEAARWASFVNGGTLLLGALTVESFIQWLLRVWPYLPLGCQPNLGTLIEAGQKG